MIIFKPSILYNNLSQARIQNKSSGRGGGLQNIAIQIVRNIIKQFLPRCSKLFGEGD